jgi:hypothetical protein
MIRKTYQSRKAMLCRRLFLAADKHGRKHGDPINIALFSVCWGIWAERNRERLALPCSEPGKTIAAKP